MEQLSNYSCKSSTERKNIIELHSVSFQGVKRLFVLAYAIAAGPANNEAGIKSSRKYFLPRGSYNVLINAKNLWSTN